MTTYSFLITIGNSQVDHEQARDCSKNKKKKLNKTNRSSSMISLINSTRVQKLNKINDLYTRLNSNPNPACRQQTITVLHL